MADKIELGELNIGDIFTFERERYQVESIGEEVEVILLKSMMIQKNIEQPKVKIWIGKRRLSLSKDTQVIKS